MRPAMCIFKGHMLKSQVFCSLCHYLDRFLLLIVNTGTFKLYQSDLLGICLINMLDVLWNMA